MTDTVRTEFTEPEERAALREAVAKLAGSYGRGYVMEKTSKGEKLTELLKQKQYVPMVAEEQVCVLYAGVRGFLDKIQTSEIGKFEKLFLDHLKGKYPHIIDSIRTEKQLTDKVNAELRQILEEFIPTAGLQMKA